MAAIAEGFSHSGKKKAVGALALETLGQGASEEDTVVIGVAEGQWCFSGEVHVLECAPPDYFFLLMKNLGQLPVVTDVFVVLSAHVWIV